MKKTLWLTTLVAVTIATGITFTFLGGCKKTDSTPATNTNVPVLTTSAIGSVTKISASCGGNISSDGGFPVTSRGVCWTSANHLPTINDARTSDGSGTGIFSSSMTGLITNTTYTVRAFAINSNGTGYGAAVTFTTNGTITDYDGNIYNTLTIGTQVWLDRNLMSHHYLNGDSIPVVTNAATWSTLTTGACCYNNNSASLGATYGRLYNWSAVSDSRKICPTGWHVPTDADWAVLTNYVGNDSLAGGMLKEAGIVHWNTPNTGAVDAYGFTALPAGYCGYTGSFEAPGTEAYFWTSTQDASVTAWYRVMQYDAKNASRASGNKLNGFSVRCVKN